LQVIKDWGSQLGLPEIYQVGDKGEAAGQLDVSHGQSLDNTWDTFVRMPSTSHIASILGSRQFFREAALAASGFPRPGLQVFLLAITGLLSQSYLKTRACYECGVLFLFELVLSCPALGDDLTPPLVRGERAVSAEDWKGFTLLIFGRFQVFIHLHKGGECDADECELFEALNELE
jgi:hypothetical protein